MRKNIFDVSLCGVENAFRSCTHTSATHAHRVFAGNWDGFHALLGDSGLGNTELQLHDSVVVQPGDTVLFNIVTINLMGGFDPWSGGWGWEGVILQGA